MGTVLVPQEPDGARVRCLHLTLPDSSIHIAAILASFYIATIHADKSMGHFIWVRHNNMALAISLSVESGPAKRENNHYSGPAKH